MITLKAEKRNPLIKAKKLRREGLATGMLFGTAIDSNIPLQFLEKDALKFIKNNKQGAQLLLDVDGKKISCVAKNIDFDPMKKQIMALDLQALVDGEKISTAVQVKLVNEDAVQGIVEPSLNELLYKANPANLLDTIEIDLEKISSEVKNFYVRDLELDPSKEIELLTSEDALIFHIADPAAQTESTAEEQAEADNKEPELV